MAEKEKDQGVAIVYLKSTPEAEWNVKMLWWDCNTLEQCGKEEWAKIPPEKCEIEKVIQKTITSTYYTKVGSISY